MSQSIGVRIPVPEHMYNYILLKNKSKCCKAPIQRTEYLYGGLGGYTGHSHVCLKCLAELDPEEDIEYQGEDDE